MPEHFCEFTSSAFPAQVGPGHGAAVLPLQGLTVLAVEDSRFASEALRLLCLRSGARLRRADCLGAARKHLRMYRPDVAIIDLGLPDGRGETLIGELRQSGLARPVLLATSGADGVRDTAMAAGADGFLEKPIESLAAFQAAVLEHMPHRPRAQAVDGSAIPVPDTMALHDDLTRAARLLSTGLDEDGRTYLAGFLTGVARGSHDVALEQAAMAVTSTPAGLRRLDRLASLVAARLEGANPAFAPRPA